MGVPEGGLGGTYRGLGGLGDPRRDRGDPKIVPSAWTGGRSGWITPGNRPEEPGGATGGAGAAAGATAEVSTGGGGFGVGGLWGGG